MPNVNRVVMLPADLYRLTMQYADDNELTWNAAVRALVERGLRQTVEPCGELSCPGTGYPRSFSRACGRG